MERSPSAKHSTHGESLGKRGSRKPLRLKPPTRAKKRAAKRELSAQRLEERKFWLSVAAGLVGVVGLVVPIAASQLAAIRSSEGASYTQRAELYRGYLGSAAEFSISAGHYICLSKGRTPSPGDAADAFKDLTGSYTRLSQTAWSIEFAAAGTSDALKQDLRRFKDDIAQNADHVYASISRGEAARLSPGEIDRNFVDLQNRFASVARSDLDNTQVSFPPAAPQSLLGCTG